MKNVFYILLCSLSIISKSFAQEFSCKNVTAELRKNATMVIRDEQTNVRIFSQTKLIVNYKIVFTILNRQGDRYNTVSQNYDRNSTLSNLKAITYDSLGVKTKEYNKSDFADQSQISDGTMYQDDRVKYLKISKNQYPYTIEFSYTQEINSNYFIPSWTPQYSYNLSIEKASYKITYPKSLPIRFKENIFAKSDIITDDLNITRNYYCEKLEAIEHEDLSTGILEITPCAYFSPTTFSFENTEGDLSTWNGLGKWVDNLSKGGYNLPIEIATKVHELTDKIDSPQEKIRELYHYLQSKTRYISVQLGIGGFKPFPAEKVAANNYGDCKALSNYMKAILKEVNIPSQLVIVKAGENKNMWSEFSSIGQANHMILCVPLQKDTVWLECTSQKNPFNYLGSFTNNRNVVLVSENGGKLVKTPTPKSVDNFQIRKANIKLDLNGDANCNIQTNFGGEQFEDHQYQIYEEPKEQKDNIYKNISIQNPEIIDFRYNQVDRDKPQLEEVINLNATKMMTGLGENLFLTLNLMNKKQYIPTVYEQRKTNFSIGYSYYDKDEIIYDLPNDLKVNFIPQNQEINSEFGNYKIKITVEGNRIIYIREQTMWKKIYPPSKYNELINFYKAIYKADKQKAVIVKL